MTKHRYGACALMAAMLLSTSAYADVNATATTDLNLRGGPGPEYPVVGVIAAQDSAVVQGCLEGKKWCQVSYNGVSGWAYGDYLSADVGGQAQVVMQMPADQLPRVEFNSGTVPGAVTGAVIGGVLGGPAGAVIGGAIGGTAGTAINPDANIRTYVTTNRTDPIYLDGEVVVGATIPEPIELRPIPDYQYRYVYLNGQPVLVEPSTRQIVYIYR